MKIDVGYSVALIRDAIFLRMLVVFYTFLSQQHS